MLSRETKSMHVSEYLYYNVRTLFLAPRSHKDSSLHPILGHQCNNLLQRFYDGLQSFFFFFHFNYYQNDSKVLLPASPFHIAAETLRQLTEWNPKKDEQERKREWNLLGMGPSCENEIVIKSSVLMQPCNNSNVRLEKIKSIIRRCK